MSDAQSIRFEPARPEHADIFIGMMQALEQADPGATPFDEQRRRLIFDQFVRDSPYGRAWLIIQGERPVGYVILTVSFSFEYRGYDAFIDELYIAEESRGREIGRRATGICGNSCPRDGRQRHAPGSISGERCGAGTLPPEWLCRSWPLFDDEMAGARQIVTSGRS